MRSPPFICGLGVKVISAPVGNVVVSAFGNLGRMPLRTSYGLSHSRRKGFGSCIVCTVVGQPDAKGVSDGSHTHVLAAARSHVIALNVGLINTEDGWRISEGQDTLLAEFELSKEPSERNGPPESSSLTRERGM